MFSAFFEGLLTGSVFSLFFIVGAASFAILQTSVSKGFYSGVQLAIGISMSDILLMSLCYFGFIQYIESRTIQIILGFTGTGLLLLFGIYTFRKKNISALVKRKELKLKINWMGVFSEIGKGFGLNFLNPFIWLFWIVTISSRTAGKEKLEAVIFMAMVAIMIFSTDLLKSFYANKLTKLLSHEVILKINRAAGIILMLFAIVLFVRTCIEFDLLSLIQRI